MSSDNLKVIEVASGTIVGTVTGLNGARDSVLTRDGSKLLVGSFEQRTTCSSSTWRPTRSGRR